MRIDPQDISLITKGMNEVIEYMVTERVRQEVHLRLNEIASRAAVEIVRKAIAAEVEKRVKVTVRVHLDDVEEV